MLTGNAGSTPGRCSADTENQRSDSFICHGRSSGSCGTAISTLICYSFPSRRPIAGRGETHRAGTGGGSTESRPPGKEKGECPAGDDLPSTLRPTAGEIWLRGVTAKAHPRREEFLRPPPGRGTLQETHDHGGGPRGGACPRIRPLPEPPMRHVLLQHIG